MLVEASGVAGRVQRMVGADQDPASSVQNDRPIGEPGT
jgi:hypothetical protein